MTFLGPFSQSVGITQEEIESRKFRSIGCVTNGLALELKGYADSKCLTINQYILLLSQLDDEFSNASNPAVINKLNTLREQKKKLTGRKKVKGVKNVTDLLQRRFNAPVKKPQNELDLHVPSENTLLETDCIPIEPEPCENEHMSEKSGNLCNVEVQTENDPGEFKLDLKELNLIKHKQMVERRQHTILSNKIQERREELENIKSKIGHYSVRNINKRDEKARNNLHVLRESQRAVMKLHKTIKETEKKKEIYSQELQMLRQENSELKDSVDALIIRSENEKCKKITAQKSNSYLRKEHLKLSEQLCELENSFPVLDHHLCEESIKKLNLTLAEREMQINDLIACNDDREEKIVTKNKNGRYTENLRLCVMELAGLEVAVHKISPVIQSVIKHLTGQQLDKSELPNPTTTQAIVDEGHFIAKSFIADKLESVSNWGLSRDGTSRRKHKILDTTVTLDTGDIMSLGFNRVAKENAETINSVTRCHLDELASLSKCNEHEYVANALNKLSFTMSDRASNEKLADKLLDQWRNEMLENFKGDKAVVNHFHCMAHVLLGFHAYITPEIKEFESTLVDEIGPIGRDGMSVFKTWSRKETVIGRVVRTTSDMFGPAGEHLGVRDRWEAFCCKNGVKSMIGNYRDNRFNAIFKTSAEVFVHKHDFISVLETVEAPNLKQRAVLCDLKSAEVTALLQCLGLFYLKVTGPYWNLVTSGKVPYFELYSHVEDMEHFLTKCELSPEFLMSSNGHWTECDPLEIGTVPHHERFKTVLMTPTEDTNEHLLKLIPHVANGMLKVIHKQLVDFLAGGKYHGKQSETAAKRTHFAPITNLGCEHHFGDLDSSQRRRPNASYHHHSSIQLLKRNRTKIMKWVDGMTESKKAELMTTAMKGGRKLRQQHIDREKQVLNEISESMTASVQKREKRKLTNGKNTVAKKTKGDNEIQKCDNIPELPHEKNLTENEYVAVAYQDSWYPGCVEKVLDESTALVSFMTPCRQPGLFSWPARSDKQVVKLQFVLQRNFVPDCVANGRQWRIHDADSIDKVFHQFSEAYFN